MKVSNVSRRRKGIRLFIILMLMVAPIFIFLLIGCSTVKGRPDYVISSASNVSTQVPEEAKGNEFILGPGDKIQIEVYRHDDLKKTIQINPSGKITYPFLGEIEAGGLSIPQLKARIQTGLTKYIIDPQVSINIPSDGTSSAASVKSQNVIVLGEVKNPGLFGLETSYTALDVVALAGGFTQNAKERSVLLIRRGLKNFEIIPLDLKKVLDGQDLSQNVYLQKGDILYVPVTGMESTSRFFDHLQRVIAMFYQSLFAGFLSTK